MRTAWQLVGFLTAAFVMNTWAEPPRPPLDYPDTRTVDVVDTYHGTEVPDPYRWLEQSPRESQAVSEWIERQNTFTQRYLSGMALRDGIRDRLQQLWDFPRVSTPSQRNGWLYFRKNDGLQDQPLLYRMPPDGSPEVVLNPNEWSADGTVSLAGTSLSHDNRYLAYARSADGSDWETWYVRDLERGRDLPVELEWVKHGGIEWAGDNGGFYYKRYPEPPTDEQYQAQNAKASIYFHRLHTSQNEDTLVYEGPADPTVTLSHEVTEDGRHLLLRHRYGTEARGPVFYRDLEESASDPTPLITDTQNSYHFVTSEGDRFFFITDRDAPMRRLVAIDLDQPGQLKTIIAEGEYPLDDVDRVGDQLIVTRLVDAASRVSAYELDGTHIRDIALPGLGTVGGFHGRREHSTTYFQFESLATPPTIYRYHLESGRTEVWRDTDFPADLEPYTVKQRFFTSQDGTRVPMFIVHRDDIRLDGAHPTLLTGYGGFNIPVRPGFSIPWAAWLDMGGVLAVANLRGGGEYGRAWHEAGMGVNKQNVFDDFIASAEYLIEAGYTSRQRLGMIGNSNGGLLVAAALTQRPDLFGAAVPRRGVLDMLRFHKFTVGSLWIPEYGDPRDEAQFEALYAYSPYHNVASGTRYPPTLVTTADTDDRVVPAHSFKFAARLQAAQPADGPPILLRVETASGHGGGTPTSKQITELADIYAFLAYHLQLEPQPTSAAR